AHRTTGDARDSVRTAQSLARLLLGDVRELAYSMKHGRATALADGLRRIAELVPSPAVHVEVPPELRGRDPPSSQALLRCAQEVVTNSIRHAGACNIWLALTTTDRGIELAARDDGRGASALRPGGGLQGMRERLEELGGTLAVETGATGFAVRATV